jgi:hypothetical protein
MKTTALFGFLATMAAFSPSLLADQVNITAPLSVVMFNSACSAQPMAFHGDAHMMFDVMTHQNSVRVSIHYNTQGVSGIGLNDGAKYLLLNATNSETNTTSGLPFVTDTNVEMGIIGQGSAPNMRLRSVLHTTVDANGRITAEFTKFSITCH